ncbi:MAG: D-alanine--D-alanine ligase [Bacteroidales bacterium]|nr:D-alanine--D-alanine ligase [Bacteroidales bacterium]
MKQKIAIVAGGNSGEFEVSMKSAGVVKQFLDPERFVPYLIIIKGRDWRYIDESGEELFVNKDDFSLSLNGEKILFDAVFVAIHGTPGEDGRLQGYFDLLGLPYTSCDQSTSALTFNKFFTLRFASGLGLKVARSVLLKRGDRLNYEEIASISGIPCFVKPNQGGSSVGMTKVTSAGMLPAAIEKAFGEDTQVLIEAFIAGREITCGVVTDKGRVRSLPVTEIISKNEFFDYEAKYTDGMADEITPAHIPEDIEKMCRKTSEDLYKTLNCRGFVRFDFIYNDTGMYFLEVNTVPGLSPNSILPQQAEAVGISLTSLFTMVLEQALDK